MSIVKDMILEYIRENDFTTYAKIQALFDEAEYDYKGDYTFFLDDNLSNSSWGGWNWEAYRMIEELQEEGHIAMHNSQLVFYYIDGIIPMYPLGKRNKSYKRLRWTPVCFRPVPALTDDTFVESDHFADVNTYIQRQIKAIRQLRQRKAKRV